MAQPKPLLKITGFSRGLNSYQIAAYFTFTAQTFFFSYINISHFFLAAQVCFSILYYIPIIGTIICTFIATSIDPTDEIVLMERRCKAEGKPFDDSPYQYHCDYCNTCANGESKHCGTCDRCVTDFDHHCHWINNCVSKKNYKPFFGAILCVGLATLIFALSGLFFMIDYYSEQIGIIENLSSLKQTKNSQWMPIVMAVFTFVAAVFCFLDIKLVFFHFYLMRNKMTTYEYIVRDREIQQKKKIKDFGKRAKKSKKERNQKITPASSPLKPIKPLDLEAGRIEESNVRQEAQQTSNREEGLTDRMSMRSDHHSQRESAVLTPRREDDSPNYKDADRNIEKYLAKHQKDLDRTFSGKTATELPVEPVTNSSFKTAGPTTNQQIRSNKSTKQRLGDDLNIAGKIITIDPTSYVLSPSASLLRNNTSNSRNITPISFATNTYLLDQRSSLKSPINDLLTKLEEEDPAEKDNSASASGNGTDDRLRGRF